MGISAHADSMTLMSEKCKENLAFLILPAFMCKNTYDFLHLGILTIQIIIYPELFMITRFDATKAA